MKIVTGMRDNFETTVSIKWSTMRENMVQSTDSQVGYSTGRSLIGKRDLAEQSGVC